MSWAGKFIVLEGCEGAGKSTQASMIADHLRAEGHDVVSTREPGGRVGGDPGIAKIRALLVEAGNDWAPRTELLLFAAARHEHVERVIRPALAAGKTVVCDRFTDSSLAYQGHGRGLGIDIFETLREAACGSLKPDLTIVVDIPAADGLLRSLRRATDATRFEQEHISFHETVRGAFLSFAAAEPGAYAVVDGRASLDQVGNEIRAALASFSAGAEA